MHAFFLTRGNKRDVDEVIKFLETRSLRLPVVDKDGKVRVEVIQGNIQPVQLWSYVFPENEKDAVLASLKFDPVNVERWQYQKKMKAIVGGLRLALGAEKIPEFKTDKKLYLPLDALENVSIIPIGVKYDAMITDEAGTHEGL